MKILKLSKIDVVKKINLKKDYLFVLNYFEEIKNNKSVHFKEFQNFLVDHQQYIKYLGLSEDEFINKTFEKLVSSSNEKEFFDLLNSLEKIVIKQFSELNKDINLTLTYNNVWFQINQYYDIKTIKFFDLYKYYKLKPQNIETLFKNSENEMLNMNLFISEFCDVKQYEKYFLGLEYFPKEMQFLWDVCFNVVQNNYSRIYLLLQEKYEIKILINKELNQLVGYWIESDNFKWRSIVNEDGILDYKILANDLMGVQYINDSVDFDKITCYLLKDQYNSYIDDELYWINIIEWDNIDYINQTLFDEMLWCSFNVGLQQELATNGCYLMIPNNVNKNDSTDNIIKEIKNKYVVKRIRSKMHKWDVCYFLDKK